MNPFRKLYLLAINHFAATPTGLAFGLAANINAEAIGNAEWIKLSPYVDGDYWEMENGQWRKYRQVVTQEHGNRMVAAFNALAAKQGENFRGLPIYSGHPDADPQRWPDERRLGGVMGVEARDDGIYVKCAWNDLGQKNLSEGYLVYPSPAWPYDLRLKAQTGRIEPIELRSIGMTNTPRIAGVPAWTNSAEIAANEEAGHPFHGNQHTSGLSDKAAAASKDAGTDRAKHRAANDAHLAAGQAHDKAAVESLARGDTEAAKAHRQATEDHLNAAALHRIKSGQVARRLAASRRARDQAKARGIET